MQGEGYVRLDLIQGSYQISFKKYCSVMIFNTFLCIHGIFNEYSSCFQDLLPLQRPPLIDVKLQRVKPFNKQFKAHGSKLGGVSSTNDLLINPPQPVLMGASQHQDMNRAQEPVSSLHAPGKLQPVKRGPSRLNAPQGVVDLGYKSEQRLLRLSPDPLRPVQMGKTGAFADSSQEKTKKLLDNAGKETFL